MIPLATTTITVRGVRPEYAGDPDADGYGSAVQPPATVLATGVRACISRPTGARRKANVDEVEGYALRCDLFDAGLSRFDTVIDDVTGVEYRVTQVEDSPTQVFGLAHIVAHLRTDKGISSGAEPANVPG